MKQFTIGLIQLIIIYQIWRATQRIPQTDYSFYPKAKVQAIFVLNGLIRTLTFLLIIPILYGTIAPLFREPTPNVASVFYVSFFILTLFYVIARSLTDPTPSRPIFPKQ